MELRRGVDSTLLTEIGKPHFHPVILAFVDWPGDPVRAHTGLGNITFGGETWVGLGNIGSVSMPSETVGIAQEHADFMLIEGAEALDALVESAQRGIVCEVYFGATTTAGGTTLVGTPVQIFTGLSDEMSDTFAPTDDGYERGVRLSARTGPSQRSRCVVTHTNETHQIDNPGDTFFRHAAGVENTYRQGLDN